MAVAAEARRSECTAGPATEAQHAHQPARHHGLRLRGRRGGQLGGSSCSREVSLSGSSGRLPEDGKSTREGHGERDKEQCTGEVGKDGESGGGHGDEDVDEGEDGSEQRGRRVRELQEKAIARALQKTERGVTRG